MLTKAELIEVMDNYIVPFYELVGTALAVATVFGAVYMILKLVGVWRKI